MRKKLLKLPRRQKRFIALAFDTCAILACLWLAFYIRVESAPYHGNLLQDHWRTFLLAPVCALPFYIRMGLYRAVLRYMGSFSVITITRASIYATGT
ncbi:MAG: hypothetical protein B0D91_14770 [Oceanospirillales bacterium LUC14_002_19_P2]|nr:MAG: hypothetical protein B0D91_14770 [Oceanospirillales bacterium LUC14_002_19_P2]